MNKYLKIGMIGITTAILLTGCNESKGSETTTNSTKIEEKKIVKEVKKLSIEEQAVEKAKLALTSLIKGNYKPYLSTKSEEHKSNYFARMEYTCPDYGVESSFYYKTQKKLLEKEGLKIEDMKNFKTASSDIKPKLQEICFQAMRFSDMSMDTKEILDFKVVSNDYDHEIRLTYTQFKKDYYGKGNHEYKKDRKVLVKYDKEMKQFSVYH